MHGKTKIKASRSQLVNGHIPMKVRHPICTKDLKELDKKLCHILNGHHQIVENQCDSLQKACLFLVCCYISKERKY